jgi:putative addiction module CopG family antidote
MPVTLPPDLERELAQRIASGQYESADAVLRAAFESLEHTEEIDSLNGWTEQELEEMLAVGVAAADAGELTNIAEVTPDSIRTRALSRRTG